jgi:hypothetical protein
MFPSDITTVTSMPGSSTLSNAGHSIRHNNEIKPIVEALEAKVGVDGSAVTTTHDYKLSGVTGTDKAVSKTGTETLTNKTLTSPTLNTPTFSAGAVKTADILDANVTSTKLSTTAITLGYAETAILSQNFTGSLADIAGLTTGAITVPAGGRRLEITVGVSVSSNNTDNTVDIAIFEDTTNIQQVSFPIPFSGRRCWVEFTFSKAPTAGSHTYKAQGVFVAGTGTANMSSTAGYKAYILTKLI